MARTEKHGGYTTDLALSWLTRSYGEEWLQWQQYAEDWMAIQEVGVSEKLQALTHFLVTYLMCYAPYAKNVTAFFKGRDGHKVSSSEFIEAIRAEGVKDQPYQAKLVNYLVVFIDHVIAQHYSAEDDNSTLQPIAKNPFERVSKKKSTQETVRTPLPYRYIQQLRQILCPYDIDSEQGHSRDEAEQRAPWLNHHFRDWTWAHENVPHSWHKIAPEVIDHDDPDCVWRTKVVGRQGKRITIYQMWSPVTAMALFLKLHLPLRSFQVRFLDSGEADTWRYQKGRWVLNEHAFAYGSKKRPYAKGIFRRIYDAMTETYSTGFYVSTNKTADQNKDEVSRGYTIPWQHEELFYWLEKLRNWQEKYNPITSPVSASTLRRTHTGATKSPAALKAMGDACFLFRNASARKVDDQNKPVRENSLITSWYQLLRQLEDNLATSGHTLSDGSTLKLVEDYEENTPEYVKAKTLFPLHSLRVSLITCYTMDTRLPLPVISKLLAGHSRLLMTIYYNKITPSVMAEKMQEAHDALGAGCESSIRTFLKDAELSQIQCRTAYHSQESIEAALANRNPIGWEHRPGGLCLVGGNTVHSDELSTLGGCWNGGPILKNAAVPIDRIHAPVPHGPENCIRCRWFITEASYLPALNAQLNQISYQAYQAASLAIELEGDLEALKDELFFAEENGAPFTKQDELQALERRYEKQRVEADEYTKDYSACFNLIQRLIKIENQRSEDDEGQKLVAVGSTDDLAVSMRFIETESQLLHLSLICDDAEFYPDLLDNLRKSPAIEKRTRQLSRMMMQQGYEPVFLEMNEQAQLIAGNALMRKMAKISHSDKMEGYRIAADYIEAEDYLTDDRLLNSGLEQMQQAEPLTLPGIVPKITGDEGND